MLWSDRWSDRYLARQTDTQSDVNEDLAGSVVGWVLDQLYVANPEVIGSSVSDQQVVRHLGEQGLHQPSAPRSRWEKVGGYWNDVIIFI